MHKRRKNILKAATMIYNSKILDTALLLIQSTESGKIVDAKILCDAYWSRIPDGEAPNNELTIDLPDPKNRCLYNSDSFPATISQIRKDPRLHSCMQGGISHE